MGEEIGVIKKIVDAQDRIFHYLEERHYLLGANAPAPAAIATLGISTEYDREYTRPRSKTAPSPQIQGSFWRRQHYSYSERRQTTHRDRARSKLQEYPIHRHASYNDHEMYTGIDDYSPDFKLTPTDPEGFRKLFFEECFRLLVGRRREFEEFDFKASRLEREVRIHLSLGIISP